MEGMRVILGCKGGVKTSLAVAGARQCSGGFTRVVVGQIKPDILRQISDDQGGRQLCRCAGFLLGSSEPTQALAGSSTSE